jgi:hypothetical protein
MLCRSMTQPVFKNPLLRNDGKKLLNLYATGGAITSGGSGGAVGGPSPSPCATRLGSEHGYSVVVPEPPRWHARYREIDQKKSSIAPPARVSRRTSCFPESWYLGSTANFCIPRNRTTTTPTIRPMAAVTAARAGGLWLPAKPTVMATAKMTARQTMRPTFMVLAKDRRSGGAGVFLGSIG